MVGIKTTGEQISIPCHNGTIFDKPLEKNLNDHQKTRWSIYAKQYEYDSKPGTQQLMGDHNVSAFHPFYFSEIREIDNNKNFSST